MNTDDRPSFSEIVHRGRLAQRLDIAVRLNALGTALESHFARLKSTQEQEAESFKPQLASWRQTRLRRVLLIDDDKTLVDILVRCLARMALFAEAVHDGAEGIARARTRAYDLVILDLSMAVPGMVVVEEIRRQSMRPDVPVLIISGAATQEELDVIARECGANAAIAKAFRLDTFEAIVERLLDRAPAPQASGQG